MSNQPAYSAPCPNCDDDCTYWPHTSYPHRSDIGTRRAEYVCDEGHPFWIDWTPEDCE